MLVLVACNLIFFKNALSMMWWVFGLVEVIGFFYYANQLTRQWGQFSTKKFTRKLFQTALIIRLVWMVFSYIFYNYMTGQPFEFDAADAAGYHGEGMWVHELIKAGNLQAFFSYLDGRYSDMGYTFYLGWQYWITGNSIFIARLLKVLYGAYTCVLIYKLTVRNFGEETGRMAAIFCMLMPNLILYTGLHTKEVEMVLLTVAFMERSDWMFRNKNFNFAEIAPPIVLAGSLFFFRTVLGATAIFALFTTLLLTSTKVLGMGKRVILIVWVLLTVGYFVGSQLSAEVEEVWKAREANQSTSMEWRSVRENGNKFAKLATGAVFAPIIFVIPFPTIIETPLQQNQKIINGGNYVKNILAFFVVFGMIWIVKEGKWREYITMGAFTIGYLLVVANSSFAHSERFHQPALPFLMVFAAYGISQVTNKQKKYFTWYLAFIFVVIVAWSWFKLAGRGMA
jgi:hypothetical protein